jgi:hypothetical protein
MERETARPANTSDRQESIGRVQWEECEGCPHGLTDQGIDIVLVRVKMHQHRFNPARWLHQRRSLMDASTFDALTRRLAGSLSRRKFVAAATALRAAAARPFSFERAGAQAADATGLVQQFYSSINAYQYAEAYALLGAKWHSQQTLATFTAGYAGTAFVQCEASSSKQASGDTHGVNVKLLSWGNDGSITAYTGVYTVGTENGKFMIVAGNNKIGTVSAGTPGLCTVADLTFAFGPWDAGAGSRNGSIVGTNVSAYTCALGGSPRVELTDNAKHTVRSTSESGSAPIAVMIKPGKTASAPLRFSNWCEGTGMPASVKLDLPGDPALANVSSTKNGISFPPCLGTTASAMGVKGWVAGS